MTSKQKLTVFYSWQSDSPRETNQHAIRTSLQVAANQIEQNLGSIHIKIDEATLRTSGATNIPASILSKIEMCDIFVADCTTINPDDKNPKHRKTPNPNVLFELGYAVSRLGWERIIILFNKAYGSYPDDLPFDIKHHRHSTYKLHSGNASLTKPNSDLTNLLHKAISTIIEVDPIRPSEKLSSEETKRMRDIPVLQKIVAAIQLDVLDHFYETLPTRFDSSALYFYEELNAITTTSSFYLYDKKAWELLGRIKATWEEIHLHDFHYVPYFGLDTYKLMKPEPGSLESKYRATIKRIEKAAQDLKHAVDAFLAHIRSEYLEIDIENLNTKALKRFQEHQRQLEEGVI